MNTWFKIIYKLSQTHCGVNLLAGWLFFHACGWLNWHNIFVGISHSPGIVEINTTEGIKFTAWAFSLCHMCIEIFFFLYIHKIPSLLLQGEGSSISRCFSNNQTTSDAFAIRPPTPLSLNDCPIFETDIVINEVTIDREYNNPNSADFIELYDGGRGNTSLDYLTLVLFDGGFHDRSYMTIGLHGYRTNSDGFFVIGASTSMEG